MQKGDVIMLIFLGTYFTLGAVVGYASFENFEVRRNLKKLRKKNLKDTEV